MKIRLIVVLGMAASMILLVSFAVGAQNPESPSSFPAAEPLPAHSANALATALGDTAVLTPTEYVFLPLISRSLESSPWINPSDRQVSLDYFNQVYRASEGVAIEWTGDHASCDAGRHLLPFGRL